MQVIDWYYWWFE